MIPPYIPWQSILDEDEKEELRDDDNDFSLFDLILEGVKKIGRISK